MNKPLLGSLVVATLLLGDASAATMYERFETMEKEMQRLQNELANLRAEQAEAEPAAMAEDEGADEEESGEEEGDSEGEDEDEEEFNAQEEIEELQETVTELNKATAGNHLKLGVDFRTSYDNVRYEMAGNQVMDYDANGVYQGTSSTVDQKQKNNSLFTNRLWINMDWAANENISFTGQLAYNKTYGGRFGNTGPGAGYETFDWFVNENANGDGNVRVKSAYWFYRNSTFLGTDIPWTFSLGRRPSTNGHLVNLRDNDPAASPSGHTINVEFDGLSSKFGLEKLTGVPGMYVKLCAGQGASSANEKFASTPYANTADGYEVDDVHLGGLIFVPYDNGQFSVGTQFYAANNLPGQNRDTNFDVSGLAPVGDLYSGSIYMMTNGIGNEWSDFLDDTTFFLSGAMSRTNPNDGLDSFGNPQTMLGSTEMENGYSYWAGLNMPSLISEEGRFGLEFNHGSKYWRPITYGEDTMIGSKVAARGNAYEAYFTEPLIDDVFSLQVRYTYIDYQYSGSNGFFGSATGAPMKIEDIDPSAPFSGSVVDKAQNIRVYLRYRY